MTPERTGPRRLVFLGLSITSSWGNGHATNYRGLLRALWERGHELLFLERDVAWYAAHRDLTAAHWARIELYRDLDDLERRFLRDVEEADAVVLGSYLPEGRELARRLLPHVGGARVFYDIDTPVTLAALQRGDCAYLDHDLLPAFDLYLSFSGGPALARLAGLGVRRPQAFYCLVDPEVHAPSGSLQDLDLGYLGTYSEDRQPALERLLIEPARRWPEGRFAVAGSGYPETIDWPENVQRIEHLPPKEHASFYNRQRFTLNVTRREMVTLGHSPSVRLFEAASCGTPILSDRWDGIEVALEPQSEVLIVDDADDVLAVLQETSEELRDRIAARARTRVLREHAAERRARQLELALLALETEHVKEATP